MWCIDTSENWILFTENRFKTVVMVFGSLITGASSAGGGAIAYPVMTLLFDIVPDVACNFSFVIQSFGMTSAAIWIFLQGIRIDKSYLLIAGSRSLIGIVLGSWIIAPLVIPFYAKMLFVFFWLSFSIALWVVNFSKSGICNNKLPRLSSAQISELIFIGIACGIFSLLVGNGLDICSFS